MEGKERVETMVKIKFCCDDDGVPDDDLVRATLIRMKGNMQMGEEIMQ